MAYQRAETTDSEIELRDGRRMTPLVTFADGYDGRAQLVLDDGCYAVALKREGNIYHFATHICAAVFAVLCTLPAPKGKL